MVIHLTYTMPDLFSLRVPTLRTLPPSVRAPAAELLHSAITAVVSSGTPNRRLHLLRPLSIPKLVFRPHGRGEARDRKRTALLSGLHERIALARLHQWDHLFALANDAFAAPGPSFTRSSTPLPRCRSAFLAPSPARAATVLRQSTPPPSPSPSLFPAAPLCTPLTSRPPLLSYAVFFF